MFRLPRQRAAASLIAVAMLLGSAAAFAPPRAEAQAAGRSVSISPDGPYQPNQEVTVSWNGFEPGPAFVTLCTRQAANAGNWEGCSEITRVAGQTGADGAGSAAFRMHSHPPLLANYVLKNGQALACVNAAGANSCAVTVSECDVDIAAEHATRENVDFAFVPPPRPPMTLPSHPVPADPGPFPQLPAGAARLQGLRTKLTDQGADAWARGLAERGLQLDVTPVSSPEVDANFASDTAQRAAWGITGLPLTGDQHDALAARGVTYTYVPVGLSALSVGVGMQYAGAPITNPTLPSDVLARIYGEPPGNGAIRDWKDPALAQGNHGCRYPQKGSAGPVQITKFYKGDRSEANLLFTSYLDALHPDLFNLTPDVSFELKDSLGSASFLTEKEAVRSLYNARYLNDNELNAVSDTDGRNGGRIASVELASALQGQAAIATITNGSGTEVRPTPEAILAGLTDPPASGLLGDGDLYFPDFEHQPATAYPMPMVFYAIVPTSYQGLPTTADGQPDVAWSQNLVGALNFMVSDDGQDLAAARGWVPLPQSFRDAAARGIAAIPTTPAPAQPGGPGGPAPGAGGLGTGGFGAGSFSDPFAAGLGTAFDGGFGDGFGTGGGTPLEAENAAATSDASATDEAEQAKLAGRRLDDSDLTPTVGLLLALAAIVLVAGRVLVLSGAAPSVPGIRRRKAGDAAKGGPGGAAPA
ncbi:MAG TPA: hypothetical protein VH479_05980 [Acidimicrobiales bacterium]